VFFLGLLDLSEQEWKALIEARGGPSYEQFGDCRRRAEIIRSFRCKGRVVTLRRLNARPANPSGSSVPEPLRMLGHGLSFGMDAHESCLARPTRRDPVGSG